MLEPEGPCQQGATGVAVIIAVPGQGGCCGRYLLLCWAPAERPRPCLAFPDTISTPLRPVPEGHSAGESRL